MNFSKFFKRNDYDKLDRFLVPQKFHSCRDPFDGDPFKIQSLKFRYADKPVFHPISDKSKDFGNSKHSQIQKMFNKQSRNQYCFEKKNRTFDSSKPFPPLENPRISFNYSSSNAPDPINIASESIPGLSIESAKDGGKKNGFKRSKSFIHQHISNQSKEAIPPMQQTVLKKKIKNNLTGKNRTDLKSRLSLDNIGGCEITIKIHGVPSNQVHINEQVEYCDSCQNSERTIQRKNNTPYEIKPSKSYVIHRDDTAVDFFSDNRQSSRKILRECSTHSMIPHKEQNDTIKESRLSSSGAHSVGTPSSLMLKSGSRNNAKLKLSEKASFSGNVSGKKSIWQRTSSVSMLDKILLKNPIVPSSRRNFTLTKSKSVLDQRCTPLPMSLKYNFKR